MSNPDPDFADVHDQQQAKRALEVAAAGGHNLLMVGPPDSGKTMLARRLPTILPPMTNDEAVETTDVYALAGLHGGENLVDRRPFRAPHHTASVTGLIGSAIPPRPGEVSLAHNGVLFLDDLPGFHKNVLKELRGPLEEGQATITRPGMTANFPAELMLVAAMNPCPCGYLADPSRECMCSNQFIHHYRSRVSGMLLDRIDIQVKVSAATQIQGCGEDSAAIRRRVVAARARQRERFYDGAVAPAVQTNAKMPATQTFRDCHLGAAEHRQLESAVQQMDLSTWNRVQILRVARTIADLDASEHIEAAHLDEAIQYRRGI